MCDFLLFIIKEDFSLARVLGDSPHRWRYLANQIEGSISYEEKIFFRPPLSIKKTDGNY